MNAQKGVKKKSQAAKILAGDGNNPYLELAGAIIMQAVSDYQKLQRHERKYVLKPEKTWEKQKIEAFFKSDWFKTLSDVDGSVILEKLKAKEAELESHKNGISYYRSDVN